MSRPLDIPRRPRQALQSYLDGLLQEATDDWAEPAEPQRASASASPGHAEPAPVTAQPKPEPAGLDEFEAAVLEEQIRDARRPVPSPASAAALEPRRAARPVAEVEALPRFDEPGRWAGPSLLPQVSAAVLAEALAPVPVAVPTAPLEIPEQPQAEAAPPVVLPAEPVLVPDGDYMGMAGGPGTPVEEGRPAWADEPFECLLFDVAGLTLAVPLVCLGSIYPLAGQELTPLFGQPEWFLGLLPSHSGNLKVLDTARWVMPDRYRDDFQQGLQYVISVQGYEWGLAVHAVSRSLRLEPSEIKWRAQRGQRPWLAGTVIEHMCALLDVAQLAEMIASGAVKRQEAEARAKAAAEAKAQAKPGRKR
jgi:purine-binding chemotaxis protein CheW